MPHQHNPPNTQLCAPTHPFSPTHPSLACQPNYLWACLLMLDKSCSPLSSEFLSASPRLHCSAFPSDRSSPLTALTPPQRLICASQIKLVHIYSLKHTHTFITLQVCLRHSECLFFSLCCCYELNKKAQCYWASLCGCEVWVEPQACWTIPFKSLFCRVSHLPGVTVAPSLSVAVVLILKAHSKMAPALTK